MVKSGKRTIPKKKTKSLKQAVSKLDKHKMKTRSANKNVSQEKVSNPSMDKLDIVDENLTTPICTVIHSATLIQVRIMKLFSALCA